MKGRVILTASEMRAAETLVIEAGTSVETLMERAGSSAAEALCRYAGPRPALILCGPGNNGGDGYVVARLLRERGIDVRVAALAEPASKAARWARSTWQGEVTSLDQAVGAPILVDALFGTGLTRPLEADVANALLRLAEAAAVRVAIDLPSGAATDDGALLSPAPRYDLTVTFAALKPSHLLQPAAGQIGRLVVADIGIPVESALHEIARPKLVPPGPEDHKYSRGYVAVLAGAMPGAAALTASAALRGGAGYVRLFGSAFLPGIPHAIVQDEGGSLEDSRIGAVAVGPGLGRDASAAQRLEDAAASEHPLVVDADGLALLADRPDWLGAPSACPILTPHGGEFEHLFGRGEGSKVDRTRAAAKRARAVVVYKGPDTVVAAPDGRAAIARAMPHWLASAGTGDVLTGIIAAMRARGFEAFEAACAGVWVQGRAAAAAGDGLIADDLVQALPSVIADCS
jgi:hydroxyethylthiazole kinase-like uncharacterized protein yjeF